MKGQEDISDVERIHQRMLEMQKEQSKLLKQEGKRKELSFITENSPMEETKSMPRICRQEGSPSPFTSQRPNNLPKRVNIPAQASSPLQQEITRNNTPIFKIQPKDYNLWFDGKEVESFTKRVENIVEIEGPSGRDIAKQIFFWTRDQDISYHIEGIPGYETGNWEQFKLDMKRIWATVSPERIYKLSSITLLFTKFQQEEGISIRTKYERFIGEYESLICYIKRYKYIQGDINQNQEILAIIYSSV
ncbi:hypothetical protein O181_090395 [Austropuccinia psidii MF-1]|uniref:Retrotransposon gag domain-containing protein n=1 Tax=Austropuccinia psidii MF-1 TaxID=1389203 RepID=A0A9Q3IUZ3_9BASI|nr:hypothetical protein [Austropuccinia psidii MF-1]